MQLIGSSDNGSCQVVTLQSSNKGATTMKGQQSAGAEIATRRVEAMKKATFKRLSVALQRHPHIVELRQTEKEAIN